MAWIAFDYGRGALMCGARILGLKPGNSVLLPSLMCSVVPAIFQSLGIRVAYYPVGEGLEPDYDLASRLVDRSTKAFLGTHFFGIPQSTQAMRSFCEAHGLTLIEDNAHGLLTEVEGDPLGVTGEIGIVSLRKLLPIPTGGALLINDSNLMPRLVEDGRPYSRGAVAASLAQFASLSLLRNVEMGLRLPIVARAKARVRRGPREKALLNDPGLSNRVLARWCKPSAYLASHLDIDAIRRQRRDRFRWWLTRIASDSSAPRPVFTELRPGVVPMALPVEVTSSASAAWVSDMRSRGVEVFEWPDLPSDSPEQRWRDRLFAIPLTVDVRDES